MLQEASNVYSAYWSTQVAPAASLISNTIIRNPLHSLKIISLNIDWKIGEVGAMGVVAILPFDANTTQDFSLTIIPTTGTKMSRMLIPVSGTVPSGNGDYLVFTKPDQVHFKNFHFTNDINFGLVITNLHAGTTFQHYVTISVETLEPLL